MDKKDYTDYVVGLPMTYVGMKKVQHAVRTRPKSNGYAYEPDAMSVLNKYLTEGYYVVACPPIGVELEYIVEKYVKEDEDGQT